MRKILGVLPVLLIVGLLTGCGGGNEGESEIEGVSQSCAKFVELGAIHEEENHLGATVEDMDLALRHCDTVEEIEAADAEYPGLFISESIGMTVENRCEYNGDLRDSPICER